MGLIPSLQAGKGFRITEKTAPLGEDEASKMIKRVVDTAKSLGEEGRATKKHSLETEKLKIDVTSAKQSLLSQTAELLGRTGYSGEQIQNFIKAGLGVPPVGDATAIGQTLSTQPTSVAPSQADVLAGERVAQPSNFKVDINPATGQITEESKIRVQAETERLKRQTLAAESLINAELKIDSAFRVFLDFGSVNKELYNLDPGAAAGILSAILSPAQLNEFRQAMKAGHVEYGAATARMNMDQARGERIIRLFAKGAAGEFDTIPMAVNNSAQSYLNALTSDAAKHPESVVPGFDARNSEHRRLLKEDIDYQLEVFVDGLWRRTYIADPEFVPEELRAEFEQERQDWLSRITPEQIEAYNAFIDQGMTPGEAKAQAGMTFQQLGIKRRKMLGKWRRQKAEPYWL
jgi:hypothetical protein